jgi:hypothetical protein
VLWALLALLALLAGKRALSALGVKKIRRR